MASSLVEALFVNRPHAKIIEWLYVSASSSESFAVRELARCAGVPSGSINRALKDLVDRQLVVREQTKYGPRYRAPFEDPRWKHLFLLVREDSTIVRALKRALRPFKSIEYACIFGSFAHDTTHKASDVDVLILETSDAERFGIMTALSQVSDKISRETNGQFYSLQEFRANVKDGDAVVLNIIGNPHITLKGELKL